MATPGVTRRAYERVAPNWLGSRITDPKVTIPGGIQLNAALFPDGKIESGTFLGRTLAERAAGTGYGPAAADDDQFAVLLYDVDLSMEDVAAGVQPNAGNILYENFLPGFADLAAPLQALIRQMYQCLLAQA